MLSNLWGAIKSGDKYEVILYSSLLSETEIENALHNREIGRNKATISGYREAYIRIADFINNIEESITWDIIEKHPEYSGDVPDPVIENNIKMNYNSIYNPIWREFVEKIYSPRDEAQLKIPEPPPFF